MLLIHIIFSFFFFFFKQKTAYEMLRSLVGSEMCIRDSSTCEDEKVNGAYPENKGPYSCGSNICVPATTNCGSFCAGPANLAFFCGSRANQNCIVPTAQNLCLLSDNLDYADFQWDTEYNIPDHMRNCDNLWRTEFHQGACPDFANDWTFAIADYFNGESAYSICSFQANQEPNSCDQEFTSPDGQLFGFCDNGETFPSSCTDLMVSADKNRPEIQCQLGLAPNTSLGTCTSLANPSDLVKYSVVG
eukprot:TRINITY_DN21653_c0_g1_i2.p1 TRINITY_DN21653_c0_g1~~TRINITY_DN21653_c0_g1_i2.p1  ORF type:complete len:246 (+),score=27.88 TRINITY_DN21653_c0_g1_i2:78-815(+)